MHRLKKVFLSTTLIFTLIFISSTNAMAMEPSVSARGAVLIDVTSNRILYSKNIDQRMRIASLTKIMTAIVAIENGDLNEMVTTGERAFGVEGSSIYLRKGEKLSLENMLYGLMLRSGNDAATAIAEHIGGSVEGFAYLMNEKAAYLGMNNTHFMNPHGLDHRDHYSTPRDMAILTSYALKNPIFKEIVGTKVKTAPLEGKQWDRKWFNKNKMLIKYKWADGVKTGYTSLAKRCLASSATKDDHQLAIITLNAPDDWNDHMKLFEYGFSNFEWEALVEKGELFNDENGQEFISEKSLYYPLKSTEKNLISKKVEVNKREEKGKIQALIGKVKVYFDNKYLGSVYLNNKRQENGK